MEVNQRKKFSGLNEDKKKKLEKEMFFGFENPAVTREWLWQKLDFSELRKKKKLDSKYGVVFNNTDFIGKKRHDGN